MKENNERRFRIPWSLIFNIVILILTGMLITYFVFSEGGFIDLLNSGLQISVAWMLTGIFVHLLNIFLDMTIIYLFLKETCKEMTFYKAFICGLTGQFFCAITPSATGGQPMQVVSMTRMNIPASKTVAALIQKFLVWQFTLATVCIIAVCARFGGDEFIIVIPSAEGCISDTEYIRMVNKEIDKFNSEESEPFKLGVSIGSSCLTITDRENIDIAMKAADEKMYECKRKHHAEMKR